MSYPMYRSVTALALLLITLLAAGCGGSAGAETQPTATPSPTPAATPDPAREALSQAQKAVAAMESLRFQFVLSRPGFEDVRGTGEWAAPDRYQLSTEVRSCPPAVPGGPAVTDCDFLPWHSVIGIGEDLYTRFGDGDPASWRLRTESSPVDLGPLQGGASPAAALLRELASSGYSPERYVMRQGPQDEVVEVHLVAVGASGSYLVSLEPETHLPVEAVVTDDNGAEWTWTFEEYGASVAIERPFDPPPASPANWLAEKEIQVVYRYLPSEPLWPGLPEHEEIIRELAAAVQDHQPTGGQPQGMGGHSVVFQFADATEFQVMPAPTQPADSLFGQYWLMTTGLGPGTAQAMVRSTALAEWWERIDEHMPRLDGQNALRLPGETWEDADSLPPMVAWPRELALGEPLVVSGRGWTGERVEVFLLFEELTGGEHVLLGDASIVYGAFQGEWALPEGLEPGTYWLSAVSRGGPESMSGRDRHHRTSNAEVVVVE